MESNNNLYIKIPVKLFQENISYGEALLLSMIYNLSKVNDFYGSNKYLSKMFNVNSRTIQRWLDNLYEKGYIIKYYDEYNSRKIKINETDATFFVTGYDNIDTNITKNVMGDTTNVSP